MLAVRIDLLLHINNNTNERMCGTLCVLDNKGENDEYEDCINQSMPFCVLLCKAKQVKDNIYDI